MTFKAADSKREEFRKYLEKSGVLDSLTKVLVGLYEEPEKPNNALDFLKHHLGSEGPQAPDIEAMRTELGDLRQRLDQVQAENRDLKSRLKQYESSE